MWRHIQRDYCANISFVSVKIIVPDELSESYMVIEGKNTEGFKLILKYFD